MKKINLSCIHYRHASSFVQNMSVSFGEIIGQTIKINIVDLLF